MPVSDQITVRKIQCRIYIQGDFDIIRKNLNENIGTSRNPTEHSNLESFLKSRYSEKIRSEVTDGSVFFIDYREMEGSFIAIFSFLIVTALNNYPNVRQGIDTFLRDIRPSLTQFGNGATVSVQIEHEHEIDPMRGIDLPINWARSRHLNGFSTVLIAMIAIFLALGCAYYTWSHEEKDNERAMDYRIEKKIREQINQQKLDYLFYSKYSNDTIGRSLNHKER